MSFKRPALRVRNQLGIDTHKGRNFEIDLIRRALDQIGGHQSRGARQLVMSPTLNSKTKTYNTTCNREEAVRCMGETY